MAKVGRPLKYEDPEKMYEKAMEYFDLKKSEGKPYTVVGLALHLGFADKQSLIDPETGLYSDTRRHLCLDRLQSADHHG